MYTVITIIFALSVVAILIGAGLARRRVSRKDFSNPRGMFEEDLRHQGISWATYEKITNALGEAFRISPQSIRPDDTMSRLWALDSWSLGDGEDTLEKFLRGEGKQRREWIVLTTVMDIAKLIEPNLSS